MTCKPGETETGVSVKGGIRETVRLILGARCHRRCRAQRATMAREKDIVGSSSLWGVMLI